MTIDEIMRTAPVIPVLVLEASVDWAALAETLVAGGLPVLEVTLRTPAGARCDPRDVHRSGRDRRRGHGAQRDAARTRRSKPAAEFIVSPGLTEPLAQAAHRSRACLICPGSRLRATSCAGSTSGSTVSNSFPPKRRAGSPRSRRCPRRLGKSASVRPAGSAGHGGGMVGRSRRCCASAGRWFMKPGR